MRTISVLLVLFSAFAGAVPALQAQPACSSGREHPRSELLVYPTQEEAATAARTETGTPTDNRYLQNLTEWTLEGDTFGTTFTVPFSWINRQVILHLDSASAAYEVSVNGQRVAVDSDPALPAEFNLTRWAHEGRNTLEIKLKPAAETAPLESWRTDTQPSIGRAWS